MPRPNGDNLRVVFMDQRYRTGWVDVLLRQDELAMDGPSIAFSAVVRISGAGDFFSAGR